MKILMTIALLILALTVPVFAGEQDHTCQGGHNCNGAGSTATAVSTGVGVGLGVGVGSGHGEGGSASASTVNRVDVPRQAPAAIAPNLIAAPETCMGSSSVGASSPFGGVSFGSTYKSESCERRMNARTLIGLGLTDAAILLMANDPEVRAAIEAAYPKAHLPVPAAQQSINPPAPRADRGPES